MEDHTKIPFRTDPGDRPNPDAKQNVLRPVTSTGITLGWDFCTANMVITSANMKKLF